MKNQPLDFLTALAANNNREWFHANKKMYDAAKTEVEQFVNSVIPAIAGFDDTVKFVEAKDCMFRIFRDVRFAKDKSPYKINMGAWITRVGRKSPGPGYYIHLQPGGSFLATGVYMPEPEQLKRIRKEIYYNIEEFLTILNDRNFKKYAGGIDEMDKAKLPPKDFPKDFPHIDILKNRHYTVSCPLKDNEIAEDGFHQFVSEAFKAMYPLNQFLRRALEE
ncbi:MAG: DUF2461 domain-containing protein [Bacteroidetes bacterium]|nr:DUF2461 domain-containing protein [Bacteroidota bacterium]